MISAGTRPIGRVGAGTGVVAVGDGVWLAVARTSDLAGVGSVDSDAVASRGLAARRAAEFRAARALLRALLAEKADADAAAGPIAARRSGQPYLPERTDLGISLSHSDGHVAAAVGLGVAVGVDVQIPVPVSPAVIGRCCTPEVRSVLDRLPAAARDRELAWIWTVQEACVKATGAGLAGRPWTIPVDLAQDEGTWHGYRWLSLRNASRVPVSIAYARHRQLLRASTTRPRLPKEVQ
jgi:4'-phosphopantetheinyl transferase